MIIEAEQSEEEVNEEGTAINDERVESVSQIYDRRKVTTQSLVIFASTGVSM